MILHLLTLNVRGLNEGSAVDAVQGYIKTCTLLKISSHYMNINCMGVFLPTLVNVYGDLPLLTV